MKQSLYVAMIGFALLSSATTFAHEAQSVEEAVKILSTQEPVLETLDQKASYMLGARNGRTLGNAEFKLDVHAYLKGLENSLEEKDHLLTQEEMQEITRKLGDLRREAAKQLQQKKLEESLQAAEAFLAENKSKEGVVTTESGLQYKIIKEGEGNSPKANSNVVVHYKGTLLDGKEFDSSYKRNQPATFNASQVIKGWTEGLQLMKPGSKFEFYIHPKLGYGEKSQSSIPANSLLIFEVELLEVK